MGASRIYRFATPYNADQLAGFAFAQTANVMYFTHLDVPVEKLTRTSHTDWAFSEVAFGPTIPPPAITGATPTTPNTTSIVYVDYDYVITGISDSLGQESRQSTTVSVSNDLTLDGNYNTISWPGDPMYSRYAVYKSNNGVFGFIGGTEGTSFRDGTPIISADLADTPPKGFDPFPSAGNYPSAVTFHQQRLLFARSRNNPNALWGSQSADFENMDRSYPSKADDSFDFALVARKVNAINQLFSSKALLALTTDSIFSISGGGGDTAITPSAFLPQRESGRGVSRLPAIDIDEVVFFQPNQGSTVRTLGFAFESDGYRGNNVAIYSPHLFENDTIIAWAHQTEPYSCIWCVMQSGKMLCFTWEQEQQVWGWTTCDTDGFYEDVAAITEGGIDRIYVIVRRTINEVETRFVERMAVPSISEEYNESCYLDCSVTQVYDPPQTTVDGLWHLEGATVSAFYDGYAVEGLVVVDGEVELPVPASVVTVGLPYVASIETLPLVLATAQGSDHVARQTIGRVTLRTLDTKGIEVACTGAEFEPVAERTGDDPVGVLPNIAARDYEMPLPNTWSNAATLTIRQTKPFPMNITGLFIDPDTENG